MQSFERTLFKLTIGDDALVEAATVSKETNLRESALDARTHALVRVAALIAIDGSSASYLAPIEAARAHGVSDDEIVGCLVAAMPIIGPVRVAAAAPKLGLGLGYDVAAALEDSSVAVEDAIG